MPNLRDYGSVSKKNLDCLFTDANTKAIAWGMTVTLHFGMTYHEIKKKGYKKRVTVSGHSFLKEFFSY